VVSEIAYKTRDAKYGYDCVRYMVQQRPYSCSMWNCYYQVVSRSESRVPKHNKFMLQMRTKFPNCTAAMVISGHQFAMISQPQGALREYLQAFRVQPDDPFINLCIGVSFINLSLGFRLSNRNQTILQGFAFLNNYQRLCKHSQASSLSCLSADEVDSYFLGVCSSLMPRSGDIRKYTEVSWKKHKHLLTGSCERAPLWSQVGYTV
jgi:general transcription factor 3C polypeptide 3 (transcription factor C subunit 4)